MEFIKLRVKVVNDDQDRGQVYIFKYVWGCVLFCARWVLVIVLSSYMEGLVEIVYDKSATNKKNDDVDCECKNQSPVLVNAVSKIIQSIVCIAFLVPILVPSVKKTPSIKPWFALVFIVAAIQLSDSLDSYAEISYSSSFVYADSSICDCETHPNQLSCSLKDRLVSILTGALCAIYICREECIRLRRPHIVKERLRTDGNAEIDEKHPYNKSSIYSQWKSQLLTVLSIFYLFSPITSKALKFSHNGHEFELYHVFEIYLQLMAWAFLIM